MNDNCFLDTNILVYCYTEDEPGKQQKAVDVAGNSGMFISTQVLTELSNTLKKKFKLDWRKPSASHILHPHRHSRYFDGKK